MRILLNCLPPADIYSPSISLSILKKFMNVNGFETAIKYWNFGLSVMSDFTDSEDTEDRLLPFLSILNDQHGNAIGNRRILSKLQALNPDYISIDINHYAEFLKDAKTEIIRRIREGLAAIDWTEISLFGITAKFNQWIPGIILAEELKKVAPHVKVVIGGFGSDEVAREAMRLCPAFDYASWGEGEYPLLKLATQMNAKETDLSDVPRLFYRKENTLVQSDHNISEYLDFDHYIYPDYSDYLRAFPKDEDREQISLPINSIRSCHWHRCNFCDFNKGYKLRARSPECVVNEIATINRAYGLTTFTFVDSDTFGSLKHFETLLDLLIDLKYQTEEDFSFWAEIIPNRHYSKELMQKMAIAGFKNLFIGYDGLSDGLLKKMNKSNTFSDNVQFIKYALKNGIYPYVNVIKHVPGETESDVQECLNNLHFLRFFYNHPIVEFSHNYVTLVLSSMSKYYKLMPDNEVGNYTVDELSYLLPGSFSDHDERFHLFRYQRNVAANAREWDRLEEAENYYKQHRFSYTVQAHDGVLYYTEYCDGSEIENIVFGEPEYAFVLKASAKKVISFDELYALAREEFISLNRERLQEVISNLRMGYLLYCNAELDQVVSLIDVE
ncbi:radical SAM protein [Carboxylicivirga mesophila]|uniref:Radical SAM protein n=1 Tax=Carboxylicivirga mesophila TaxID=1166478 RepID=A0ABS5K8B7_9BACT|nr:radical SAM protein [Carboxylicivirga mesophila]MBS2211235.1 radical SAM protein [Carboxylicivirga mesophila]